jgi:biopolymer transport protein ExbB
MKFFAGLSSTLVVGGWSLVENAKRARYQLPTTNHQPGISGAIRGIMLVTLLVASSLPSFAQAVKVDEKADQVAALQIELEQARQNRDRVITKRWEDKARDTEAREKFNQEYDELKNKLELKNQEADRLHAEIQNYLRDAEEAQARAEEERVRFLGLASSLRDKARDLAAPLEKSFPARIPERLQALNRVLKSADTRREAPGEILTELMVFERAELALTREISLERRGFLRATKEPGEGLLLRLGTVTAAYRDTSGKVGLLLKNTPDQSFTPFDWKEALPVQSSQALSKSMTMLEKESGAGAPVLIPMDVLLTQNLTKSYTQDTDKGFFATVWETLVIGGVFLIPLGLILIALLIITYRKYMELRRARQGFEQYDAAAAKVEQGDTAGIRALHLKYPRNLVIRILDTIAARREAGRSESEKAAKEILIREVPRLERGLTTLAVLAAAAPMLGLLGTISGLVAMFQVITEMGVNDPKMLAGGIGEALISTEAGLLIAIPALLGHNYLANRVDDLVAEAEYRATRTLNTLWPKG